MTQAWVYGAIALLSLLHVVVLVYAYRKSQGRTDAGGRDREYVRANGIECPECGALNERGYRYCRQCVAELPGPLGVFEDDATPQERRTL